ncbi:MAG TPA: hypothetical protein VEF76_03570 [Patescibacteria group bacterium]|nr:hypothetical protein [Patescibacteria group bacterium]
MEDDPKNKGAKTFLLIAALVIVAALVGYVHFYAPATRTDETNPTHEKTVVTPSAETPPQSAE